MNRIFIAELDNDRIHCLNLDLTFHSFIGDIFGALDVKLTPEGIVVLSCGSPFISLYSYSNQLIRRMISVGEDSLLKSPYLFVLGEYFNLLSLTYTIIVSVCTPMLENSYTNLLKKETRKENLFNQETLQSVLKGGL